jgi:cell division protein FtsB
MLKLRLAILAALFTAAAFAADQQPALPLPISDTTAIQGLAVTVVGLIVRVVVKEINNRRHRIAGTHTPQSEREWLRTRIEKLEQQVKDLHDLSVTREAEMGRLRVKVAELEQHNDELTKQVMAREQVIAELTTNVKKLSVAAGTA